MRPLKVSSNSDHHLGVTLRRVWQQVLDEVWISRSARVITIAVVAISICAAASGWADVNAGPTARIPICLVALTMLLLTAVASSLAALLRRFRWCCAAAYTGGLSTATGVGVVWWHQSAPPDQTHGPSSWMVIGVLCSAWLTATWLRVILTPLERSQPDIRRTAQITSATAWSP
jgi:hypothetical protein